MKCRSIRIANAAAGTRGDSVPKNRANPSNVKLIPRYIGFLLKEKGNPVMRAEDFSKGFTVV
jgi:hypothetical protein